MEGHGTSAPNDKRVIQFYNEKEKYGFFSNFSPHPILLGEREWPTTEHYFQAQKFAGTDWEEQIRLAPDPKTAKAMGRSRHHPLRADWEQVKDSVMRECLVAKFTQHKDLRAKLVATGNAKLVEHTRNDSYWGDGGDGSGKNMLGRTLMSVREELAATHALKE
ncbi:Swarming motility protein YbiA [Balamuthia mandrillaris]